MKNSLEQFHQLPAKKRLDFIINHHTPLKLVRDMSTPDLLLIIRELGAESSLELIEMLHSEQVKQLFDVELWTSDQLDLKACGYYLSLLLEADRDRGVSQIHNLDVELIGYLFRTVTTVYDLSVEEPMDYPNLYSTSPDNHYLVCFHEDDDTAALARALHTFLESLYGRDLEFALRLIENLRFELPALLEEESLRWRQNRLLDLGILPREERLEFFASLDSHQIKRFISNPNSSRNSYEQNLLPTVVATNFSGDFPYMRAAMAQSSNEVAKTFSQSLMHAAANMHASLSGDFGDRQELESTLDYVKFLVELGIFQSCRGQMDAAYKVIPLYSAKLLIRLGRTTLVNLRKRLVSNLARKELMFGIDYCHADAPLRQVAQALSLPEPRYYVGLLSTKELTVRYFKTLAELNATIFAINELIFRAELIGSFGLDAHNQDHSKFSHLSHVNLYARCLINAYLGFGETVVEISSANVDRIFYQNDLTKEFVVFANGFGEKIAKQLARSAGREEASLVENATNFTNAVLIQLTNNWQLAIG